MKLLFKDESELKAIFDGLEMSSYLFRLVEGLEIEDGFYRLATKPGYVDLNWNPLPAVNLPILRTALEWVEKNRPEAFL